MINNHLKLTVEEVTKHSITFSDLLLWGNTLTDFSLESMENIESVLFMSNILARVKEVNGNTEIFKEERNGNKIQVIIPQNCAQKMTNGPIEGLPIGT